MHVSSPPRLPSGLKKVSKDQMTHKNPSLRASSVVKDGNVKKSSPAPKKAAAGAVKKPPVCELQGKKWVVEYQEDNPNIAVTDTNVKQSVYVFRCTKSTIKVTGKVNSIILGEWCLLAAVNISSNTHILHSCVCL